MIVIKMDDYDWVACETIEQGIDFYLNETGVDFADLEIRECDIDEEGMWWLIDEFPDEIKDDINYGDMDVYDGVQYGYWAGEKVKHICFREVIELYNEKFPYIIASTEF